MLSGDGEAGDLQEAGLCHPGRRGAVTYTAGEYTG